MRDYPLMFWKQMSNTLSKVVQEAEEHRLYIELLVGPYGFQTKNYWERRSATTAWVEIQKEIPEPLGKIRTDLGKLSQILFHLLDNAVKFTEHGTIKIGARLADGRLHCWVDDTGIGICADDQRCIWDEFYQVDDRASARYRGAGLGLTLVHDLITMLEGDSMLTSEPGVGTRLEFSLPVAVV